MFFGNGEETEKFVAPPDFDGPTKHRHCTDVLCLLLLICNWVAMTFVGLYAMKHGDYRVVLYPLDYDGNICGTDFGADMTDYPKLLYVNNFGGGVCVKDCPDLNGRTADGLTDIRTLITYNGTWQPDGGGSELDPADIQVGDYSTSNDSKSCTALSCFPYNSSELSWNTVGVRQGFGYAYYATTTYEVLFRCIPPTTALERVRTLVNANASDVLQVDEALLELSNQAQSTFTKLFADLYVARKYVLGFGFGVTAGISLVYIFLMRFPGLLTTVIWTSIATTIALFGVAGYYAYNQALLWEQEDPKVMDDTVVRATRIFSYVLFVLCAMSALLACCLRRAIMEAILCTKQAGRAVNSMTLILLVPILQTIGFFIFFIPFMTYAINVASMAQITTTDVPLDDVGGAEIAIRTFEFDSFTKQCGWYLLFCLFWTANFIVALGDMIIAVSVAKWYFSRNKLLIGSWTVLFSIFEVIFYHAGTCAFGSLLVAIVQLIRAVIAKAQEKAKETGSKIAQILLCCCQCFFWCMECCLKFINKNAYIQTAIFSTSFCTSCRESFGLIFRNFARVSAVSYVSAAVLIVGKLFISTAVTLLGYYAIVENLSMQLNSIAGPCAVVFLISYWVSDMFMDVLDMGILTVLHCFIADEEMFDGEERYQEKELKEYVDKAGSRGSDDRNNNDI